MSPSVWLWLCMLPGRSQVVSTCTRLRNVCDLYENVVRCANQIDDTPSRVPGAGSHLYREHVQSERGQSAGEPLYEDILPHVKDQGQTIELESNVAYYTLN